MRSISRMQTLFVAFMLFSSFSFVGIAPAYCGEDNPDAKQGDPWAKAEAAFAEYIAPLVKGLQTKYDDPKAQYVEFRSALLKKYLPDYRVFAQDCMVRPPSPDSVFILDRKGNIVPLGDAWNPDGEKSKVQGIMDVIKAQGVKIENAEVAIDVAKLIDQVGSAASNVSGLRGNSKNNTVFDSDLLPVAYGNTGPNWAWSATKRDGGWTVKISWAGDLGTSIIVPPKYEIDVDEKLVFRAIRENTSRANRH